MQLYGQCQRQSFAVQNLEAIMFRVLLCKPLPVYGKLFSRPLQGLFRKDQIQTIHLVEHLHHVCGSQPRVTSAKCFLQNGDNGYKIAAKLRLQEVMDKCAQARLSAPIRPKLTGRGARKLAASKARKHSLASVLRRVYVQCCKRHGQTAQEKCLDWIVGT